MIEVNGEIFHRLRDYAKEHGYNWKRDLRDQWLKGTDANEKDGHLLRQARNQIGPSGLEKIQL